MAFSATALSTGLYTDELNAHVPKPTALEFSCVRPNFRDSMAFCHSLLKGNGLTLILGV